MENVQDILSVKGDSVVSVGTEDLVITALVAMAEKNIGAILVLDDSGKLAGIFSERDFARKIIVRGRSCDTTKVKEVMTPDPLFVEPGTTISACMRLMTDKKFRHLPVKKDGRLVGVISIGDVVKAMLALQDHIISEQAFEIGQMERTIPGAI